MEAKSAGLLMYRKRRGSIEVLLIHPGGPLWAHRDRGSWSIPKGLAENSEDVLDAAQREFREETGFSVAGPFLPLKPSRQKSGKIVHAWAVEGSCNPDLMRSNTFSMEWPPHSGIMQEFPEADRAAWFILDEAKERITPGQRPFLQELEKLL